MKKQVKPELDTRLLQLLVCPVTGGKLVYDKKKQNLVSKAAKLAYPVQNGIPLLLPEEATQLNG